MNTTYNTGTGLPESQDTTHEKITHTSSSHQVEGTNAKIDELKAQEEVQKSKEQIQAEIMSYFIQHPDENILLSMHIFKNPENLCEVIDFGDAEYEDENLRKLFNGAILQKFGGLKIEANETGEQGEEFAKELVIDRASNIKGILLVGKKGFKIEKVDFENINKYTTLYETYFVYKKEGKTYVKILKSQNINVDFKVKDSDVSGKMNFGMDGLDEIAKIMPPEIMQAMESIKKDIKEAKRKGYLDPMINAVLNDMQVPNDAKEFWREELYRLANN